MTLARVQVYDPLNVTYRGLLTTQGMSLSHEVGSAGSLDFTAAQSDLTAVDAWDSVLRLQLWDGSSWVTGPVYALRPPYTRAKVTPAGGGQRVEVPRHRAARAVGVGDVPDR